MDSDVFKGQIDFVELKVPYKIHKNTPFTQEICINITRNLVFLCIFAR